MDRLFAIDNQRNSNIANANISPRVRISPCLCVAPCKMLRRAVRGGGGGGGGGQIRVSIK